MMKKISLIVALLACAAFGTQAIEVEDSTHYFRPAYHFTPKAHAMGTPVGLNYDGEQYRLFYSYNADGLSQENYSLACATSSNLIDWKEQGVVFSPGGKGMNGASCVSDQGGVVSGKSASSQALILAYVLDGEGVHFATSADGGVSWADLSSAIELPIDTADLASDPKLMWHEETKSYVLLLARTPDGDKDAEGISFYTSINLKDWTFASHIRGLSGSPDLIQLPVDGSEDNKQWVLSDRKGNYMLGSFNGRSFSAMTSVLDKQAGDFLAPISYYDSKNKRTIQFGLLSADRLNGVSYCGVLSLPMELSLKSNGDSQPIMVKKPVAELSSLDIRQVLKLRNKKLIPGLNDNPISRLRGVSTHIKGEFDLNTADAFGFLVLNSRRGEGTELLYNVKRDVMSWAAESFPIVRNGEHVFLEIFVDRSTVEIFVNGGEHVVSTQLEPMIGNDKYVLSGQGGELIVVSLNAHVLR